MAAAGGAALTPAILFPSPSDFSPEIGNYDGETFSLVSSGFAAAAGAGATVKDSSGEYDGEGFLRFLHR